MCGRSTTGAALCGYRSPRLTSLPLVGPVRAGSSPETLELHKGGPVHPIDSSLMLAAHPMFGAVLYARPAGLQ